MLNSIQIIIVSAISLQKRFNSYFVAFALLIFSGNSLAQTDTTELLNDRIFNLLENVTEDEDDSQLYELFDELLSDPIDLNSATVSDLTTLPFVSALDAKRIVNFIKRKKGIKNFDELHRIKNIDDDLLVLLKPFVKIFPQAAGRKDVIFRSRFIEDVQDKENSLTADKLKSYQRLKGTFNNLRFGILAEKDAGEKSFTDFYSGFVQYKSKGTIKNIIAGDFVFEFGQGLAVWSPYAFSKGSDATSPVSKRARNFVAYSSSDENNYFRGVASELDFGFIDFSAFYSDNKIDANLYGTDSLAGLYLSGYHRTKKELAKKDNVSLITAGVSAKLHFADYFDLSLLHLKSKFGLPFYFKNRFALYGKDFSFTSAAYNFHHKNISVNGEFSYNGTSVATINNLLLYVNKSFTFVTSVRSYPRNYFNLFSNGFGEKNSTQNELGFYIGMKWKSNYGTVNIYYDIFKQPAASYNSVLPAAGNDFSVYYNYKIKKDISLNLKYKRGAKEKEFTTETKTAILPETRNNLRVELNYKLTKNIFGRNRIELVKYSAVNSETGFLTFQDVKLYFEKFSLIGRIIFFDTESYYSRIYEFENNHRGVLTNLPMFGNGFRWYFIFNYEPVPQLKISVRYSETYKPKLHSFTIGKTNNKLEQKNRVSLQVDLKL